MQKWVNTLRKLVEEARHEEEVALIQPIPLFSAHS
jgi:hypothetical protein